MPDSVKRFFDIKKECTAGAFKIPMMEDAFSQPQGLLLAKCSALKLELEVWDKV